MAGSITLPVPVPPEDDVEPEFAVDPDAAVENDPRSLRSSFEPTAVSPSESFAERGEDGAERVSTSVF